MGRWTLNEVTQSLKAWFNCGYNRCHSNGDMPGYTHISSTHYTTPRKPVTHSPITLLPQAIWYTRPLLDVTSCSTTWRIQATNDSKTSNGNSE